MTACISFYFLCGSECRYRTSECSNNKVRALRAEKHGQTTNRVYILEYR